MEVLEFNIGPVPPEYFELPPDLIPAEDSWDEEERTGPEEIDDLFSPDQITPDDTLPDEMPPDKIFPDVIPADAILPDEISLA